MIAPHGGAAYALTDMSGPGTYSLFQSFVVGGPFTTAIFTFSLWNQNYGPFGTVVHPAGLDHLAGPNQHLRVDLMAAGAPPFSTAGSDVLANFYLDSEPFDPSNPWITYSYEITAFVATPGAYMVRFAEVDNMGYNHMGVDDVSVFLEDHHPDPPDIVPEPATVGLMMTGLLGLGVVTRRRRKA